ncbi:MAG: hypothetical protein JXR95_16565 [Deltaproteobacteria bacterium]|nr:hypothetical protein [Deltaproteobacteria bacterium]
MKKLTIFLPAVIFIIASCSSNLKSRATFRVGSLKNHGNKIVLLPLDVRVDADGANSKKRGKIWEKSLSNGFALMRVLPSFLESRNYEVTRQIMWNGVGVDVNGKEHPAISDKKLARAFFAMSGFSGKFTDEPLNHRIAPDVFKALGYSGDLTLYSAQWTTYKHTVSGGKVFLKTLGIVLAIVLVAVVIVAVIASAKGNSGGGGGIFNAMGKLFGASAKGVARTSGTVLRAVAKTAGRVAINTAKIATRVTFRIMIENGPIVVDLPEQQMEPVYAENEISENADTSNRWLGVYQGISPLKPLYKSPGLFYAFALVENSTGRIIWDSKIFVPQGSKTKDLQEKLKKVFNSLPYFKHPPLKAKGL